jgi:two-component system, response regulator PdtaR
MPARTTVLVVEDELLVRLDLVAALENAGYQTLQAGSATEAISILETHAEIRVVFTDIQMPGTMDGIALAHCVRKRWPPTIIVVSSGKVRPATGELADDMAFLAKPYHPGKLAQVLSDVAARLSR